MKEDEIRSEETNQLANEELEEIDGGANPGFPQSNWCPAYANHKHVFNRVISLNTNGCKCGATKIFQ